MYLSVGVRRSSINSYKTYRIREILASQEARLSLTTRAMLVQSVPRFLHINSAV